MLKILSTNVMLKKCLISTCIAFGILMLVGLGWRNVYLARLRSEAANVRGEAALILSAAEQLSLETKTNIIQFTDLQKEGLLKEPLDKGVSRSAEFNKRYNYSDIFRIINVEEGIMVPMDVRLLYVPAYPTNDVHWTFRGSEPTKESK